ncbi:helix-turn-helix transcriptional regulator [Stakelama saccharophila]|uniref:Response regulator transcription factor n=1 Tax=Stakelama saccharophila TaxID=3075605 RepID=A0ABZ0BA15_9SPHN|nr:response regulator transcription factor [Stakelama sp. W311]WNO54193.1 response regulator transcription factor [Stakelama sp. W311]
MSRVDGLAATVPYAHARVDRRDDLPAVVVIDRSPFNRNCIAAGLRSSALATLYDFERVADVPEGLERPMLLFLGSSNDSGSAWLETEVDAARRRWPDGARILLLAHVDGDPPPPPRHLFESLTAIVADELPSDMLLAALQLVHHGHAVLPGTILHGLLDHSDTAGPNRQPAPMMTAGHPLFATSTARQREVIQLLVTGLSNKAIANRLNISESTVKAHIRAIMELLGAENRTQIVARVMRVEAPENEPTPTGG